MRTLSQCTASGWGYGRGSCRPRLCFGGGADVVEQVDQLSLLHVMYFLRLWADKIQESDATPSHCLLGVLLANLSFQTYKCHCLSRLKMVLSKSAITVLAHLLESRFD